MARVIGLSVFAGAAVLVGWLWLSTPTRQTAAVAASTPVPVATRTAVPQPRPQSTPDVGQMGWLYATLVTTGAAASGVPVANSTLDFNAYRKALRAKDDVGMRQLYQNFELVDVATGTRVLVIDSAKEPIDIAQVRFVDGPFATSTGWVDRSWIVAELPANFVRPTSTPAG